ncbi:MAG: hypothetical protein K2Y09_11380 [Nitrosomonas sp.]|nr:hypothetical protein [Nitrosomonas sp.]
MAELLLIIKELINLILSSHLLKVLFHLLTSTAPFFTVPVRGNFSDMRLKHCLLAVI